MNSLNFSLFLWAALVGPLCFFAVNAQGGESVSSNSPPNLMFTTESYRREALRLVLGEANDVARALKLEETLPIVETNLFGAFITPYGMVSLTDTIGNVTTSNYIYSVSIDRKFSFVDGAHEDADRLEWFRKYSLPISQLDTNSAYQLATQWLGSVSMDVAGLNRDCNLHVVPVGMRKEESGIRFLPLYWVYWTKGPDGQGSVASVGVFLPLKKLVHLRVENSKYILRRQLEFTNLDALLAPPAKH